jgi:tetratricopeptide (TPR) repeat protein
MLGHAPSAPVNTKTIGCRNTGGHMKKRLLAVTTAAALLAHGTSCLSAEPLTWKRCTGNAISDDDRIAACTAVIASTRTKRASLAKAYLNRCEARGSKYTRLAAASSATSGGEGILASAIQDCSQAIHLAPNKDEAYFKRALYYTFQKDYARAIADYNRTVQLRPKSGAALAFRGMAYLESGAYDQALSDCTEALKRGYTMAGFAEDCVGKAGTAKQRLAGGQKLGDPRAWCDGKALAEEGFPQDRQIEGCTQLINSGKEEPDDLIKDHLNRATAYDFEGAADKAIDDYNVVIGLQPQNADVHGSLGMIYWVKKDYDRAIGNFDKAIAFKGSRMDLYYPYRGRSIRRSNATRTSPTRSSRAASPSPEAARTTRPSPTPTAQSNCPRCQGQPRPSTAAAMRIFTKASLPLQSTTTPRRSNCGRRIRKRSTGAAQRKVAGAIRWVRRST